jgi:hypothetical protein
VFAPFDGSGTLTAVLLSQVSRPLPDLSGREFWSELPQLLDCLMRTFGTILHPDDQNLVYLRQPTEGLDRLLALGIETVFHEYISLQIVVWPHY